VLKRQQIVEDHGIVLAVEEQRASVGAAASRINMTTPAATAALRTLPFFISPPPWTAP